MKTRALISILILSFSAGYAQTNDSVSKGKALAPWWVEKFRLSAGFFEAITNTKVQVGLNGAANGTEIDFQKDLGLAANFSTFMTNFQWRISRRSRINLGYFNMQRNATHAAKRYHV
jgi:hypothetical protein